LDRFLAPGRFVNLQKQKRLFVIVLVSLVVGYALLILGAFAGQGRLIYPRRGDGDTPELTGARLETLASKTGRKVFALYAPASNGAPVLVHFHGNGEELADLVDFVALFQARGIGVLAVEYPGYGLSRDHEPNEGSIYEDAEVALRHLIDEMGVSRERIVLSGQSLGSGVAVEMACRGLGARLLLFSPYTSMVDMADHYLPILPNRWLVRDRFDNGKKAPRIALPVLVVHGTADEVIPVAFGKKLAGAFPAARFLALEHGRHNDLFLRGGASLVDEVTTFCRGS
jgi:alpha-beta hydrolase superfamily lysophospholipase